MIVDTLRVICITLAALQTGMTARIIQRYYQRYKLTEGSVRGLLPHHVWMIGLSYLLLMVAAVSENVVRIGEPLAVWLPLNLLAFSLGTYALIDMIRYQGRMIAMSKPRPSKSDN